MGLGTGAKFAAAVAAFSIVATSSGCAMEGLEVFTGPTAETLQQTSGEDAALQNALASEGQFWLNPDEAAAAPQSAPPKAGPYFSPRSRAEGLQGAAAVSAEARAPAPEGATTEETTTTEISEADETQGEPDETASLAAGDDPKTAVETVAPVISATELEDALIFALQVQSAPPQLGALRTPRPRPPKQPSYVPPSVDLAKVGVRSGHEEGERYFPDPKQCNAVYLHDNLRKKPNKDADETHSAFAGHWVAGMWDGKLCQEVVVEEVREDGTARSADLRGRYTPWDVEPLAMRREAAFADDGSMIVPMSGGKMTFWLSDDRMYGVLNAGGRIYLVSMTKRKR
ncbi:MAG: hypothetical protein ACFB0F_14885 [Neomegalonema sp.]